MAKAPDWLESRNGNFYCIPGECWLDPGKPARRAVISHAHGDHFPRWGGEVFASKGTISIAQARYPEARARNLHALDFGTPTPVGPVSVELLPAGHILGSSQVFLKYEGESILFSGDFSLMPNRTCQPLKYPSSSPDLLICESTFGLKTTHADPEEEMRRELKAAGTKPMLIGVYALGKAQRLTEMINRLAPEKDVRVHPAIASMNRAYEQNGIDLGEWGPYRRQEARGLGYDLVYLVPPRVVTGYANDKNYHKLIASGWKKHEKFPWLDGKLEISDHADAREIQEYILKVKPGMVGFWHGYPEKLLEFCADNGISAFEYEGGSH